MKRFNEAHAELLPAFGAVTGSISGYKLYDRYPSC
jgi:hypothetical protein